jgi:hypothetical protein
MTIQVTDRRAGPFSGNGVITDLPFLFKVFEPEDIAVVVSSPTMGEVTLFLGADYTVTLNPDQDNNPGGTVTLLSPLQSGVVAMVISDVPYVQPMNLTANGRLHPAVLNDSADRMVILIQQLLDKINNPVDSAINRISYAEDFPVTGTNVHLDFPVESYFTQEPVAYICVNGGDSPISWVFNSENLPNGAFFTSMDITFNSSDVGKQFSVLVVSNG